MGVYEALELEWERLHTDTSAAVALCASCSGALSQQLLQNAEDGIAKADKLVRALEAEARKAAPEVRPLLLARLRERKVQLLALKKSFRARLAAGDDGGPEGRADSGGGGRMGALGQAGGGAVPSDLRGGYVPLDGASATSYELPPVEDNGTQRARLLSSAARLGATTGRLGDTRRTALQAEQLGVTILQDLHSQRESLLHAHDVLHDVDDDIGRARRILHGMALKMHRNKWISGLILLVLFGAIAAVIYLRLH